MKYHVNAKGEADVCNASVRSCPLGNQHYETLDEAEFAAELSALVGERIEPAPSPTPRISDEVFAKIEADTVAMVSQFFDVKAESRRVIQMINDTSSTHQFFYGLLHADNAQSAFLASELGLSELDDHLKHRALKKLAEDYFEEHGAALKTLPPEDVFSLAKVSGHGSDAEAYALTRQTLASSVGVIERIRLLTTQEPRNDEERAYLSAQGEMTVEMVVEKARQITSEFRAGLSDSMAFVGLTTS